jgi:hypothetical protein
VLAGLPTEPPDLTPLWFRELDLVGTYATGGTDFGTALDLAGTAPLGGLLGPVYPLRRWPDALDTALSAGRSGAVKVAFNPRSA